MFEEDRSSGAGLPVTIVILHWEEEEGWCYSASATRPDGSGILVDSDDLGGKFPKEDPPVLEMATIAFQQMAEISVMEPSASVLSDLSFWTKDADGEWFWISNAHGVPWERVLA